LYFIPYHSSAIAPSFLKNYKFQTLWYKDVEKKNIFIFYFDSGILSNFKL
jgi:hypothetical protein